MDVFNTVDGLIVALNNYRQKGKVIGFVPTMGALHQGHIELIRESVKNYDITVCSIYVNPTQFNNPDDLDKYPRMPEKDIEMLNNAGCKIVFTPSNEEIYPKKDKTQYNFGDLEKVLEGKYRPGHFKGVAMVVRRLFNIIEPHNAYFGLKDYQQYLVIKKLVKQYNIPVKIIGCPTVRENDGLAMSSRNLRLQKRQREAAPLIYENLLYVKNHFKEKYIKEWEHWFIEKINNNPQLKVEYFEIIDANTLEDINDLKPDSKIVACTAVFAGEIRLIDNVLINY